MVLSLACLLQISVALPLLWACILLIGIPMPSKVLKGTSSIIFIVPMLIGYILWSQYGNADKIQDYTYISECGLGIQKYGISLKLGLNGISLPLYVLTSIIACVAGLYALYRNTEKLRTYIILLVCIQGGLLGSFASINIFYYYFFHELAFLPTFIGIGILGGQGRRSAAMEMGLYLISGGLIVLIGLIALGVHAHSFDLICIRQAFTSDIPSYQFQKIVFGCLLLGFGTLASLFPLHAWAISGYTAAPTSISMLHSGVLKQFGIYGLLQIALPLLPAGLDYWKPIIIGLGLCNILIIGLITTTQVHLKRLISYSSVMHVGYCFLAIACFGIGTSSILSFAAVSILMFGYGLVNGLLFLLNDILYQATGLMRFANLTGLYKYTPRLGFCFGIAFFASIGVPGFGVFWGELLTFFSIWQYQPIIAGGAILGIVLSAVYVLRIFANIFMGAYHKNAKDLMSEKIRDINKFESLLCGLLILFLIFIGIYPKALITIITPSVHILEHLMIHIHSTYKLHFFETSVSLSDLINLSI